MGITYHTKRDPDADFDVNFSGAQVLFHLHRAAGAAVSKNPEGWPEHPLPDFSARVPYRATVKQATTMADKVESLTKNEVQAVWETCCERKLIDMTPAGFRGFVKKWVRFLRQAAMGGGYEAT